ncbi:MAG TPA: ChaB family protein [Phototrophicaceae bacterium]|jgi:cation transport regulator|nr:ChaB family protein [Phototrophicaceae bacterium]
MPYRTTADLPDSIRTYVPRHAQVIYLEAFNLAWEEYKYPEDRRGNVSREQISHQVAWSAVKKVYVRDEITGKWKPRHHRLDRGFAL